MTALAVRTEYAKMRHLRVGLLAVVMVLGIAGLSLVSTAASGADTRDLWATALAGLGLSTAMVSPLLIAVIASRTMEIEHQSNGWLMSMTAGSSRGRLCRAKLVSTGLVVAVATTAASLLVLAAGSLLGAVTAMPTGLWVGYTLSAVVVNLVVLALHLIVSARVENQLLPLGLGILGTVVALSAGAFPAWLAHLTPWGYYALIEAAEYQGDRVVTLSPSYLSVAVLAALGGALFYWFTRRLDRQEV